MKVICMPLIPVIMTSMAVASTGVHPTQNLIVPTTQNTAPVLDFRCLYSYDLRRKQKRWQDGLLRFHTFNKRIMVYDVPRNYIGDTHWRDESVIGDGDEFELDRGVLIQVGEATGSMEQDLTGLLEKRKKPRDVVPGQASSSPVGDTSTTAMASPAVAQTSLLKPKSLNALLGTPKGPIGRASLSKKSPHEMRKTRNDLGCGEGRPTKRLRTAEPSAVVSAPIISQLGMSLPNRGNATSLDGEKENFRSIRISRNGENNFSKSRNTDPSPPGGQGSYRVAAPIAHETISAVKPRAENRIKSTRTQGEHDQVQIRPKVRGPLPRGNEAQPRPTASTGTGSYPDSLISSKENAAESVEIVSDIEVISSSEPRKKKMKLQMASRKPRRKLLYRDFLPQDSPAISRSLSGPECRAQCGRVTTTPSGSKRRSKEPLTKFHEGEPDQLADRLNRRPSNEGVRNAGHKNNGPSKPLSSSLFLSQEDSDNHWIERHTMTDDSANFRNLRSTEDASEEHPNHTQPTRAPKTRKQNIPKASSTVHDTELTLTKLDEILFSHPQSKATLPCKIKDTVAPVSPIRIGSQSPIPPTPKDFPPGTRSQNGASPAESITSSPTPKTYSPAPTPKPATRPPIPISPSHPTNPITTSPTHPPNPLPKIQSLQPPKPRSRLKQTTSDPSNIHPPPPLVSAVRATRQQNKAPAAEQINASAWGAEAWDLFGCGRDGVACTYEEFKRKEGLM